MVQARQEPGWALSTLLIPLWLSWLGICPRSLVGNSPPWEREWASPCLVPAAGWGTGDGQGIQPDHSAPHLRNSFHPSRCKTLCSWVDWLEAKQAIALLLHGMVQGSGSQPLSPRCEGQFLLWEVAQAAAVGQGAQGCFSTLARVIAAALE